MKVIIMKLKILVCLLLAISNGHAKDWMNLAGAWRLRLDPDDQGAQAGWAAAPLTNGNTILLPNTTDRAGFGFALDTNTMRHATAFPVTTRFPAVKEPARADEHGYLVRRHLFVGPAWYERDLEIPVTWTNRSLALRFERALWKTDAWIDGRAVGSCDSLVAEHRFELGALAPGRHRLTVRVDNRLIHNLSTITHAYGPETQSRWNGLIGDLKLEAAAALSVRSVAMFPAADRRSARAVVVLANARGGLVSAALSARLFPENNPTPLAESVLSVTGTPGLSTNEITLKLDAPAEPWDEFAPRRYRVQVRLENQAGLLDEETVHFGFRHLERVGKEIRLNGRPVFLRGTLDCAVYPNTGHPPMSVPEWQRVLGVVKEYGFNHVRFHTWCPPDAAFEAADQLGVYLQAEAPAWIDDWGVSTVTKPLGLGRDADVTEYLRAEVRRISEAYGNHPSFMMFTMGNEFGLKNTDWERVNALVEEIKTLDPRRLYSGCTARRRLAADDYWVTHNSGMSTRGVGTAQTDWDFTKAAEASPVPLIAHETGQRPVFPDYEPLLQKFTGPLLPLNLERYRRALVASGRDGQVKEFVRASARFQLTQYKAEHEAMRRTRGYAGYQLLMLNDFTGQSEALVGILDPFWESKGVVSAAEVRAWNAPTVLLARFPRFVWSSDDSFRARIELAHSGPSALSAGTWTWSLTTRQGETVGRGTQETASLAAGSLSDLGEITAPLGSVRVAAALTLRIRLGDVENLWNLWVYPASGDEPEPKDVLLTKTLDDAVLETLRHGGKVLWLAHGLKNPRAARTGFESVYWSAGWWGNQFSSLGLLCDPQHPALAEFPNDGWSDWQWRDLCAGATTLDLEGAPAGFRPIIQPVPDFHFNALLAHLFEAKVGPGSLVICGYDLATDLDHRPATRQFRRSLFRYLAGPAFRPQQELAPAWLERTFASAESPRGRAGIQHRTIEGWAVHVSDRLFSEEKAATEKALELLEAQLRDIIRVVPAAALARLRQVPLWMSPPYPDGRGPRAEYHPNVNWLRQNGRDPAMAQGVEMTNIRIFERETRRMPFFILHELAHAYHDQVLGFDHPEIKAAYASAKQGGRYNDVQRWTGEKETRDRAYALTDPKEYFAEASEAFFGRNDFEPFTREELKQFDPEMFRLLAKLWGERQD